MRAWNREERLGNHFDDTSYVFKISPRGGRDQRMVLSARHERSERREPMNFTSHDRYEVTGRSLILFALEAHGETGRVLRRLAVELSSDPHKQPPQAL